MLHDSCTVFRAKHGKTCDSCDLCFDASALFASDLRRDGCQAPEAAAAQRRQFLSHVFLHLSTLGALVRTIQLSHLA
jgi:hypothetical protein